MLYLSALFILAGASALTVAIVIIAFIFLTSPEKIQCLRPQIWPDALKKWLKIAGAGALSVLMGMLWASLGT